MHARCSIEYEIPGDFLLGLCGIDGGDGLRCCGL